MFSMLTVCMWDTLYGKSLLISEVRKQCIKVTFTASRAISYKANTCMIIIEHIFILLICYVFIKQWVYCTQSTYQIIKSLISFIDIVKREKCDIHISFGIIFKDKQGQTHKFAFLVTNHLFIYLLRFTYFVSNCPWPICGSVECVLFSFQDLVPSLIVLTICMYKRWFNICILLTIYNSNNISISIIILDVTYDFMLPPSHLLV